MPGFKRNSRTRKRITIKQMPRALKNVIGASFVILVLSLITIGVRIQIVNITAISKHEEDQKQVYEIFTNEDYDQIQGEKVVETDKSAEIVALGNILYDNDLYESLYDDNTGYYLFSDYFDKIRQYVQISDYTIANLGVNIIGDYGVGQGKTNAPEDLAVAIKSVGIDLVNTANSNSYDEGRSGIVKTLEKLDSTGIIHTGTARAEIEKLTPIIQDIKGIQVAFLSYTEKLNKTLNSNDIYMVNQINKEKIIEDVKKAKDKGAEFIIVSLNWSKETSKDLGDYLINNGVDFILGNTNSGEVGDIQVFENNEGKNVGIVYDMGNFIGRGKTDKSKFEISLNIQITKSAEDGIVRITKVNYNPMYLIDKGEEMTQRYMLVDMKQEIQRYEANVKNNISDEDYSKMLEFIKQEE